jgi:hypothetical protein
MHDSSQKTQLDYNLERGDGFRELLGLGEGGRADEVRYNGRRIGRLNGLDRRVALVGLRTASDNAVTCLRSDCSRS